MARYNGLKNVKCYFSTAGNLESTNVMATLNLEEVITPEGEDNKRVSGFVLAGNQLYDW